MRTYSNSGVTATRRYQKPWRNYLWQSDIKYGIYVDGKPTWLYRTSGYAEHPIVIYQYQETRQQEHPQKFLSGFKGYLHTDGYQCYHNLPPSIIIVGCWAHAHRYWEELYESIDKSKRSGSNAERGLLYINLLFWFEDEFCDLEPEERYKKRLELSKPVSDEFFEWAGSLNALPKSLLGKAINYSLSQRTYLENVYLDGKLEFSNNRAKSSSMRDPQDLLQAA